MSTDTLETLPGTRPIRTDYYFRNKIVQVNRAKHANSAVLRCVDHMQLNTYGATSAEVYDTASGELHAVVTRQIGRTQKIEILYRRPVEGAQSHE